MTIGMTKEEFEGYVETQVKKAHEEIAANKIDLACERLDCLRDELKSVSKFMEVGNAKVNVFRDSLQREIQEATTDLTKGGGFAESVNTLSEAISGFLAGTSAGGAETTGETATQDATPAEAEAAPVAAETEATTEEAGIETAEAEAAPEPTEVVWSDDLNMPKGNDWDTYVNEANQTEKETRIL